MWRGSCSSHQLPLIPLPVLRKQLFFIGFIEYPELERTHKDHCVQLPALHRRPANNPTLSLKALSKHSLNFSNPRGTYPSQNEGSTDPQLHIPGKLPLCSLGRIHPVFLMQGCSSSRLLAMGMDILEGASPLDCTRNTATPSRKVVSWSS